MTIEEQLKDYICLKYKNLRNFINTSEIDMPYTTLDGILKRGIGKSSIDNVFKLCDVLEISADALKKNMIIPVEKDKPIMKEYTDYDYIFEYMTIDGEPLNEYEQWNMKRAFHGAADTIRQGREMFKSDYDMFYENDGTVMVIETRSRKFCRMPSQDAANYLKDGHDLKELFNYYNSKLNNEDKNK